VTGPSKDYMRRKVWIPLILTCLGAAGLVLYAQAPNETPEDFKIIQNVTNIVVPVGVYDHDDNIVNGLQGRNFHLFDNGKEQDIAVDVNFHPISLVIAIQSNAAVEKILPQVRRIGSMLESFVVGDQGEAAVLAFDHRFMVKQDFTNDVNKISESLKKITPGSTSSRLVDACEYGVRMLHNRPPDRRRVLLLISETRDYGSEGKLREVVIAAQVQNVSVYTVNMSRMIAEMTGKAQQPKVDQMPPANRPMPSSVPGTPTSVMQMGNSPGNSADFYPLMIEMLRDVKAVFKDNPAEALTKATGGQEFSFVKQKGLEESIAKIGSELHSQYLITYSPSNKLEGGFHEIKVTVEPSHNDWKVRSRPGYWLAATN